jgi:Ca2+-binding RTX toxin-like protein
VWAVYGQPSGADQCDGDDYCIWGDDATGTAFCCPFPHDAELYKVVIRGSDYGDQVKLNWSQYDLQEHPDRSVTGTVFGNAGADDIQGSRRASPSYLDDLHGDGGMDTIDGQAGNDNIFGDDDDDTLLGGAGADEIHGGSGDDDISGEAGADTLLGDNGGDLINGDDGNDDISGGYGADLLCAGTEYDTLAGLWDNDQLWGDSFDADDGGPGTDDCDTVASRTSCEGNITTKPPDCH